MSLVKDRQYETKKMGCNFPPVLLILKPKFVSAAVMTKEILYNAIQGIDREIRTRKETLNNFRSYLINPVKSGSQFYMRRVYSRGPVIMKEIWRLKVIKAELFYQYSLTLLFENLSLK